MKLTKEALEQVVALTRELAEVRAERDRLAERIQRLWDIALEGGQDAGSVRRALLAEMTPGELLQVRRADPAGGVS